jgi:hypothetical protein
VELGKPVLYYKASSDSEEKHMSYVIEEAAQYQYALYTLVKKQIYKRMLV